MAISAIAWAEFLCGPLDGRVRGLAASLFTEVVPFGAEEAAIAADLFNSTGRRRGTLMDCMVASIAISSSATLATSNVADFRRFDPLGLSLH